MRPILTAIFRILPAAARTPAAAEMTQTVETRFGVGYTSDPLQPRGGLQALYEGRYTASFDHQADNGVRFRFDLGIAIGNFDSQVPNPRPMRLPPGSVGFTVN